MAKVEDLLGAQLEPLFLCSGIFHKPVKGSLVQKDSLMWTHSKNRVLAMARYSCHGSRAFQRRLEVGNNA
jgi:hypothetical protein